jgi:hypothetical protein
MPDEALFIFVAREKRKTGEPSARRFLRSSENF